jgi:hypothetical protein
MALIRTCHLPEDDNHHSHRRGNLKSYTVYSCLFNGAGSGLDYVVLNSKWV